MSPSDTFSPVMSGQREAYADVLRAYLAGAGEQALERAYVQGREALHARATLLDVTTWHHRAIEDVLAGAGTGPVEILAAAAALQAERLAPFEMAYRGFREANAALRHVNDLLEDEARRIAVMLHDEAGQQLFALQIALAELTRDADPALQSRIDAAVRIANELDVQLRLLSHEIRPAALDDLGLVPALEAIAQKITRETELAVVVNADMGERLPKDVETALFRAVSEAVSNVRRHAQASRAVISLQWEGELLRCSIADNGKGFDAEAWIEGRGRSGLGLMGIRERLARLDGGLELHSEPGQGTELIMTLPLHLVRT